MNECVFNVLFLCHANSARTIMAEAILNHRGRGRFRAFSAGREAHGYIEPWALETLRVAGIPTEGLTSKSWEIFSAPEAPRMDFVFVVCREIERFVIPVWLGRPTGTGWGVDDPAAFEGTCTERRALFLRVFQELSSRIDAFVSLPTSALEKMVQGHRAGKGGTTVAAAETSADG